MGYFFRLNDEKKIGFKRITDVELGLSPTSNQTHIGLYEGVLDFLDDTDVVKSAMLIYENYCDILDCSFDRIKNPDGTYRSPKIRIGDDGSNSVVAKIKEIAGSVPRAEWFLVWTGLESKELVFWLFNEDSADYKIAMSLFPSTNTVIDSKTPSYDKASDYLLRRINLDSIDVQKDIEIKSQIGDSRHIYKRKDIENAEIRFRQVGKIGEELIAQYLEKEKRNGSIQSFIWENQSKESGLPFDFIINNNMYVDVKSTPFDFEQHVFYSDHEIDFALSKDNSYSVYRVFDIDDKKRFRICQNCKQYMSLINKPIVEIQKEMTSHKTLLQTLKIGVKPQDCFITIQEPIIL